MGDETSGRFGPFEHAMKPGSKGAKPHVHRELTEIFDVADGEVELTSGRGARAAPRGRPTLVPPGSVHGFANPGPARSTLLVIFCPADHRERYVEGMAELTREGRRPSREELLDLMRRLDQEPVDPP